MDVFYCYTIILTINVYKNVWHLFLNYSFKVQKKKLLLKFRQNTIIVHIVFFLIKIKPLKILWNYLYTLYPTRFCDIYDNFWGNKEHAECVFYYWTQSVKIYWPRRRSTFRRLVIAFRSRIEHVLFVLLKELLSPAFLKIDRSICNQFMFIPY